MLYEDIQKGSEKYHRKYGTYVGIYDDYFASRADPSRWRDESSLDADEVNALMTFLNGFGSRMDYCYQNDLGLYLRPTLICANLLSDKTLLSVDFNETVVIGGEKFSAGRAIEYSFSWISKCPEVGPTVASKILHAINPELFVMWDGDIIDKYGGHSASNDYVDFLRLMQRKAMCSISQIVNEKDVSYEAAVESFTACSHSVAKVLDEYNFAVTR